MSSRVPNGRSPHASHARPSCCEMPRRARRRTPRRSATSSRSSVDRPRRELELTAGLDRDLRVAARERDRCDRPRAPALPPRVREPREQRADAVRARRTAAPRRSRATTPISSCSVPTRHSARGLPAVAKYASSSAVERTGTASCLVDEVHAGSGTLGGDPVSVNRMPRCGSVRDRDGTSAARSSQRSRHKRARLLELLRTRCVPGTRSDAVVGPQVELLHRLQAGQPRRRGCRADRRAVPRRSSTRSRPRPLPSVGSRWAPIRWPPRRAIVSFQAGRPRSAFIVRKEPKGHGTGQWVESTKLPGGREGRDPRGCRHHRRSTLKAIERARLAGLECSTRSALVDRLEGGREAVEAEAPLHHAVHAARFPPRPMKRVIALAVLVAALAAAEAWPVDSASDWPAHRRRLRRRHRALDAQGRCAVSTRKCSSSRRRSSRPSGGRRMRSRDADVRGLDGAAREQRIAQAQADTAGPYEIELHGHDLGSSRERPRSRQAERVARRAVDEQGNEIEPLEIVKDKRPVFTRARRVSGARRLRDAPYIARFPRRRRCSARRKRCACA